MRAEGGEQRCSLDPTSRNWLKLEPGSNVFGLALASVMIGVGGVQASDTVVVSAAAGAAGSIAAQIAKGRGARVIGIAMMARACVT